MSKRLPLVKTKWCAVDYGAAGFPTFSAKRGTKRPATIRGFYNASTSMADILNMWRNPYCNIALRTGKIAEELGLLVLDFDGKVGQKALCRIQKRYGKLPITHLVESPNGFHIYLLYDASLWHIPSSVGKIAEGMDVRAEGAYIIAPPSVHPSGKQYRWVTGNLTPDNPPAYAPTWLLKLLAHPKRSKRDATTQLLLKPIRKGERNDTLTRVAGSLFAHNVPSALALPLMYAANEKFCCPPLKNEEVLQITKSIARREVAKRKEFLL